MDLLQKSNPLCLKRKPVNDCLAKDSKSRHVEVENVSSKEESGSSSDLPAHSCCSQPNLANDCVNYLKSGVPNRIVIYKQGSWCDFPEKIVKPLVDGFKGDKSSIVVVMDDQPLLVDFLSMTLVNLQTRKQRSVAWLDGTNKWFFPSSFFDEEVHEPTKLGMSIVEGGTQGFVGGKVMKSPSEVVKQVIPETSLPVAQNPRAVDILHKKIVHVERGSEIFLFVQNLFLSGMGSCATPNNILHIHWYSPKDITAQCKLEAFERQMRLTREKFGDANARYGWVGSRKQDIVSAIINGFVRTGKSTHNTNMGAGIYLSPENRAFYQVMCQTDKGPTSPWISFRVLFETIQDSISSLARELLFHHYEELKENKITREEMVKKMMIIVGEKLFVDSSTKLKYRPSLWFNSPAKIAGSPAANAVLKGQHSPTPSMCSENFSSRCTDSQDPFAPIVAPLAHDGLVRSALLSVDGCHYVGPSMESNGQDPLVQCSSKGHDSHVSRPTLGNSDSSNTKGLYSVAPSMIAEVHEFIAPSNTHEDSLSPDAKGIPAATSSVPCEVHAPSMVPQLRAPRSMSPLLCAPRSVAPHLCVLSKTPKVHKKSMMPEANYSGAATMVPVICKPPMPSVLPMGHGFLTSTKECSPPSVTLQSPDCPAKLATKRRNTPN